jgi:hypothetical protein
MSKRRAASIMLFKKKNCLKYPVRITAVLSGTGTGTNAGLVTVVAAASAAATRTYMVLAATTNLGVLVGTAVVTY